MAERVRVSSGSRWESTAGYSRAIRVGNRIDVAGTTAVRNGTVVGVGDPYAQAVCALEIIREALEELGATLADVVRTRMFVTDISKWEEIGRAHGEYFRDVRPASTLVQVQSLIDPDLLVEIEAEAIIGD